MQMNYSFISLVAGDSLPLPLILFLYLSMKSIKIKANKTRIDEELKFR